MTLLHIAIETFFVAVGVFAVWSIFDSFKQAWPTIMQLLNTQHDDNGSDM